MSTPTDRQRFRETVAQVAEKARSILPTAVNGRVEKAVTLVLQGDVAPQADGTVVVFSATDATRRYVLQGHGCTCADFERGQAPEGWCCHRIAAGIAKRVQELRSPEAAPERPAVPLAPLGEAPASVNCHIMVKGRQIQLTLRDTDESRLLERLTTILRQYPDLPQPNAKKAIKTSGEAPDTGHAGWCPVHDVAMQENEKDGRRWFSHRTDQGWCKGRRSR
jgi:predicted nucleic acid-binding Zn finger protein